MLKNPLKILRYWCRHGWLPKFNQFFLV